MFVVNHALMARVVGGAAARGNVGVTLSRPVVFLIKLDHFFEDYFYVLIPFFWITMLMIFLVIQLVLKLLGPKSAEEPR